MSVSRFIERLSGIHQSNVFNPWSDICSVADYPDAPVVRRNNLAAAIQRALSLKVDTVLIGRDLGYRGGRRTGLALTDEANLTSFTRMYGGNLTLSRATRGPIVTERTAAMFWEIVGRLPKPVFTWNVFPFHPFEDGNPLSNRCHTRAERTACRSILVELLNLLQPTRVIAIGNDAELGLLDLDIKCAKVRHPSYGGKADFIAGMTSLHPNLGPEIAAGKEESLLL